MASLKTISSLNLLANAGSYLELNNLNKKTADLTKITKEIADAQIRLQKEQLDIQTKALIQQEMQTKIMAQQLAQRERQKELKNVFYNIKTSTDTALRYEDNFNKLVYLSLIERDINEFKLNPNELEELSDKEYTDKILNEFSEKKKEVSKCVNENDLKQIELISDFNNIKLRLETTKENIIQEKNNIVMQIGHDELQPKLNKLKKKYALDSTLRIIIIIILCIPILISLLNNTDSGGMLCIILLSLFLWKTTSKKKISDLESQITQRYSKENSELHRIQKLASELSQKYQNHLPLIEKLITKYPNLQFLTQSSNK